MVGVDGKTRVGKSAIVEELEGGQFSKIGAWEQAPARIKVIGVGGGGCNCVRRMSEHDVRGVQYVMVNTDIKSLEGLPPEREIDVVQIGQKVTRGWGAGGDTRLGERAAEESSAELRNALKESPWSRHTPKSEIGGKLILGQSTTNPRQLHERLWL